MNQVEVVAACRVAALVGSQVIDIDNRIDEAEPGISSPGRHTCPRRIAPSHCAQRSFHPP